MMRDKLANALILLRRYLWRAFLTSRHELSSTKDACQDYRGLRTVLCDGGAEGTVPIMNEPFYPLPTNGVVVQVEWPRRKTIVRRGILGLQINCGAEGSGRPGRGNGRQRHPQVTPSGVSSLLPGFAVGSR